MQHTMEIARPQSTKSPLRTHRLHLVPCCPDNVGNLIIFLQKENVGQQVIRAKGSVLGLWSKGGLQGSLEIKILNMYLYLW